MKKKPSEKFILKTSRVIEFLLAVCILTAVAISLMSLSKYFVLLFQSDVSDSYKIIKDFLGVALLLAISIELVLMILAHSTSNLLELVLFAVAQKMLVYSDNMLDILLGTVAIAIVFGVKQYLTASQRAAREEVKMSQQNMNANHTSQNLIENIKFKEEAS
jgi:type III secretory pathway component EscU